MFIKSGVLKNFPLGISFITFLLNKYNPVLIRKSKPGFSVIFLSDPFLLR